VTWFYVDDHLHDHRKARRAGTEAMGMWVLAGSWCADNLTDGFVPVDVAWRWGGGAESTERLAKQLVTAGLWEDAEVDGEVGWRFHDWSDVQKTRDQVLDQRQKRQDAGRRGGIRSGESRRSDGPSAPTTLPSSTSEASAEANASALLEAETNPVPSRPVPSLPNSPLLGGAGGKASQQAAPPDEAEDRPGAKRAPRRKGTRIPDSYEPSEELIAWARTEAPHASRRDHEQFVDWWGAKSGAAALKTDWDATWRNWMRRASDENDARRTRTPRQGGATYHVDLAPPKNVPKPTYDPFAERLAELDAVR
jgi:hypothetical protein